MGKDVKIVTEDSNFKYRTSGIVCVDDKVLLVEMHNNGFYCIPGGHVEIGEDSMTATLREMKEELGYEVQIEKILGIIENFYIGLNGKKFHELGFYYIVKPKNVSEACLSDYDLIEHDKDGDVKLKFRWVKISDLDKIDVRPKLIKEKLMLRDNKIMHEIIKN